jgi:hypothetical protein
VMFNKNKIDKLFFECVSFYIRQIFHSQVSFANLQKSINLTAAYNSYFKLQELLRFFSSTEKNKPECLSVIIFLDCLAFAT